MIHRLISVAALSLILASTLAAAPIYMRSTAGPPWGQSTNEAAMDAVFGAGQWTDETFETANLAALLPTSSFIFLEGGDNNADELEAFLTTNLPALEAWVFSGGRLLVNAAPNEGDGMSFGFGGVVLTYPGFSSAVDAANPAHPVFIGPFTPVGTSYTGSSFAHALINGGGVSAILLATDNGNGTVLGEKTWGSGLVLFGGMTTDNFHSPSLQAANLRANIISYTANDGAGAVPEPGTWMMLSAGLAAVGLLRRKNS